MKRITYMTLALLSITALSCNKVQEQETIKQTENNGDNGTEVKTGAYSFKVSLPGKDTKISLSDGEKAVSYTWESGDKIVLVYDGKGYVFTASEEGLSGNTATFTGDLPEGLSDGSTLEAYYPCNIENDGDTFEGISFSAPNTSDITSKDFASSLPMYASFAYNASAENPSFTFENQVSILEVHIKPSIGNASFNSLSVMTSATSGKMITTGTFKAGEWSDTSKNTIDVDFSEDITASSDNDYVHYFAVPPQEEEFKLQVCLYEKSDDDSQPLFLTETSSENTIGAGKCYVVTPPFVTFYFKDSAVGKILQDALGDMVGDVTLGDEKTYFMTFDDAAKVDLNEYTQTLDETEGYPLFSATEITTFDEFQYFTGMTSLDSKTIKESYEIGDGEYEEDEYDCGFFDFCASLTSITLPSTIASIGKGAFDYCTALASIEIPSGVTSIGWRAFFYCTALTEITFPEDSKLNSIGEEAFGYCEKLKSIEIPEGVTTIESGIFYKCTALTSITIPDNVTSIGSTAFSGCESLASITIPDKVTSIGVGAFSSCPALESITIPKGVTTIAHSLFYSCKGLKSVTFKGVIETWNRYVFAYFTSDDSHTDDSEITKNITLTLASGQKEKIFDYIVWSTESYNDATFTDNKLTYNNGTTLYEFSEINYSD